MKNNTPRPRILLDTSFILPSLGIEVSDGVSKGLKKLAESKAEIHYSHFSILESLWVAARTIRNQASDLEDFRLGLRSVVESGRYRQTEEDSEVFNDALRLYMLGHKDMIDNMLYTTSIKFDLKFLTLDSELKEFTRHKGLRNIFTSPDEIASS